MIRTMELILGLEPLSQYDAAARPMSNSFTSVADLTPYTLEAAQINLEAKNNALAYGADRSTLMDFTEYDRIDDFELNEILWHSIMGTDAPTPPAVRRAIAFRSVGRRQSIGSPPRDVGKRVPLASHKPFFRSALNVVEQVDKGITRIADFSKVREDI